MALEVTLSGGLLAKVPCTRVQSLAESSFSVTWRQYHVLGRERELQWRNEHRCVPKRKNYCCYVLGIGGVIVAREAR